MRAEMERGLQTRLAKMTGLSDEQVSKIFLGKRRATPEQAILLEKALDEIDFDIPMTKCDFVFNMKGRSLTQFLDEEKR